MSANQDLLVRNEWKGVEIADLARAQLAHFADLVGSRIAVRGPKLRLRAASAQAIGLALHELATNAGKYGALSTDAGCVHISWGTDGGAFTMSWTERGGPAVSQPERRGFGTVVMETMAERSVDGKVDLDYAPSGLNWRLTCPAANALEPWEREEISSEGPFLTLLPAPPYPHPRAGEGEGEGERARAGRGVRFAAPDLRMARACRGLLGTLYGPGSTAKRRAGSCFFGDLEAT